MQDRIVVKPIKRVRLYENAVEQIQSLILKKKYMPGDRLPAERTLAEQFKISRPSLREALRVLDVMGFIEIKVGDGIYVKEINDQPQSYIESLNTSIQSKIQMEKDAFIKLWEVRKFLEVGIVELAAEYVNEAFLKGLWRCIEEMEKNIDDQDTFTSWGIRFHRMIAETGRNEILILLWDNLGNVIRKSHDKLYRIARSPRRSLEAHRRIYLAFKEKDVKKACEAMRQHMLDEEKALSAALGKVKAGDGRSS